MGQDMAEFWPIYHWELRDSSENHAGCMGSIRALFDPKISKIGPEMTKLRPIYQRKVA